MGVPKLWELVQGCGQELTSLAELDGKILAIDASIWIHSFIRAMRDERGVQTPYAHLVGFFWRIIRLLSNGIRPVFVFDGDIPFLKKKTIEERRKRRDTAATTLERNNRKLLLLNTLKQQLQDAAKGTTDMSNITIDDFDIDDFQYDFQNQDVDSDLEILSDGEEDINNNNRKKKKKENNLNINNQNILKFVDIDNIDVMDQIQIENEIKQRNNQNNKDKDINNNNSNNNNDNVKFKILENAFSIDTINQESFTQLPQDIQIEILNQLKLQKQGQDKIVFLTPPKDPKGFSTLQLGSLIERGKITQKIYSVMDSIEKSNRNEENNGTTTIYIDENEGQSQNSQASSQTTPQSNQKKTLSLTDKILLSQQKSSQQSQSSQSSQSSPSQQKSSSQSSSTFSTPMSNKKKKAVNSQHVIPASPYNPFKPTPSHFDKLTDIIHRSASKPISNNSITIKNNTQDSGNRNLLGEFKNNSTINLDDDKTSSMDDEDGDLDFNQSAQIDLFDEDTEIKEKPKSLYNSVSTFNNNSFKIINSNSSNNSKPKEIEKEKEEIDLDDFNATGQSFEIESDEDKDISFGEQSNISQDILPIVDNKDIEQITITTTTNTNIKVVDEVKYQQCPICHKQIPQDHIDDHVLKELEKSEKEETETKQPLKQTMFNDADIFNIDEENENDQDDILESIQKNNQAPINNENQTSQEEPSISEINDDVDINNNNNNDNTPKKPILEYFTSKERERMESELELETVKVSNQVKQQIRSVQSINDDILLECHELLRLFGIPFITSPTEAESQCAELFKLGLVDGVVTDDSDIFLFSPTESNMLVIRHMFQKKPQLYYVNEIQEILGLTRDDLINLAMLLGCDYTQGIDGIGIVNAIEIISEFKDLNQFKEFINSKQPLKRKKKKKAKKKKATNKKRRTPSKKTNKKKSDYQDENEEKDGEDNNVEEIEKEEEQETTEKDEKEEKQEEEEEEEQVEDPIFRKLHPLKKKVRLPDHFPSEQVRLAFTTPDVNRSNEELEWGEIDLDALKQLTMDKFGWDEYRLNYIVRPIQDKFSTPIPDDTGPRRNARLPNKLKSKRLFEAIDRLLNKTKDNQTKNNNSTNINQNNDKPKIPPTPNQPPKDMDLDDFFFS